MTIYFAVVTKIPEDGEGNMACADLLITSPATKYAGANIIVDPPKNEKWEHMFARAIMHERYTRMIDLRDEQVLLCNTAVFRLGEIMVMDSTNNRTIPDGRKPSKWNISYECFESIEDTVARAKEVTA